MTLLRVYDPAVDWFDRDGYPQEWAHGDTPIKDLVREQAGNRCVRCQHPYAKGAGEWSPCDSQCTHDGPTRALAIGGWVTYDTLDDLGPLAVMDSIPVQAQWRILTVHHLDGAKSNCRWWNLAALCQRCHLTIQGRVVMERAFIFEHSAWFKPYAAGWYAHKYLGEDLTGDETLARLDELLGLERLA